MLVFQKLKLNFIFGKDKFKVHFFFFKYGKERGTSDHEEELDAHTQCHHYPSCLSLPFSSPRQLAIVSLPPFPHLPSSLPPPPATLRLLFPPNSSVRHACFLPLETT